MQEIAPTFVPGTMCDRRVWEKVWRELGGDFRPRYLDVETRLTRSAIGDAFDEGAADGAMDLVGFSMGGYLSLEYALNHPERVRSLVVVCSSARGLSQTEKADRAKVIAFLETHKYRGISTSRINQFVHPSQQANPEVVGVIRAMDHDLGQDVLLAQMRETSERQSLMTRLGELACPVMFAGAVDDGLVRFSEIEEMHRLVAGSRLARAADAGHMLPLEQPGWLAAQIADFYAGI